MGESSRRVVTIAILANLGLAASKFIAAAISGSAAILSEAIHSTVDTLNECLLMLGQRRSHSPPDAGHPFGHGKELYFWSLIVAVLLFGVGGGMTIYQGIVHLLRPEPLGDVRWSFGVLALAAIFDGWSFTVAYRAIGAGQDAGRLRQWWRRIRRSKDPSLFVVFLEDLTALFGIVVAALGIALSVIFDNPYFDGAASVLIGLALALVAVVLAHESRGLLVGESARPQVVSAIEALVSEDPAVLRVSTPVTMQLSPESLLVNVDIQVDPALETRELLGALDRIERRVRREFPAVSRFCIRPKCGHADS